MGKTDANDPIRQQFEAAVSACPLERTLYADMRTWLPDGLLMKVDKMAMATSLEARTPFLDQEGGLFT